MSEERKNARKLAQEAIERGTPLDWFESLYDQAQDDASTIPWADMEVNPNLAECLPEFEEYASGTAALVVGCGLGDDAEALSAIGFDVTAFDISATCIDWCRQRFSGSRVDYIAADLFHPPTSWSRSFGFVFEAYTLQVLPTNLRGAAIGKIADFVAPNGTLFVISRGRDEVDSAGEMPWPLLRRELDAFSEFSLTEVNFEDYWDREDPSVRRFRAQYRRLG